jgi:hypothetical protein
MLASQRPPRQPGDHLWATDYHPCARNLTLKLTQPEAMAPMPVEVQYRLERGRQREADIIANLIQIGKRASSPWEVVRVAERVSVHGRNSIAPAVTGIVDVMLRFKGEYAGTPDVPIEIKSWPMMGQRITCVEDLNQSRFTRGAEMQILTYLYGKDLPRGLLLLDLPGELRAIDIVLEERYDSMEKYLSLAEQALGARKTGEMPPFFGDPDECRDCPFFARGCFPMGLFEQGADVSLDPAVIADVARDIELHGAHLEYERVHDRNKERFRDIERAVVGDYIITGKEVVRKLGAAEARVLKGWKIDIKPLARRKEEVVA